MSFIGLIIDFLESRNLENLGLVGITTRQPEDKISIFKTFYVPIKHFMSKYTVFVSNLIYFSQKNQHKWLQDKDIVKTETPLG